MPWRKMRLRNAVVLARSDESGELLSEHGRVEIRYRAGDARAYRAAPRNLQPIAGEPLLPDDACPPGESVPPRAAGGKSKRALQPPTHPDGAIIVYADGACSGNPGPAGVGIVLIEAGRRRELSHYLGEATNNIAELTAIALAAEAIEQPAQPVRIHTDSQYAIGVLSKGWKAKANVALVAKVQSALRRFGDLQLIHVRGHSGIALNERADALAVQAVSQRSSQGWVDVGATTSTV